MRTLGLMCAVALALPAGAADWKVPEGDLGFSRPNTPAKTVDLGQPGALDELKESRPELYGKIVEIMRVAGDVSCETLPQMLKAQHDVSAARCSSTMILTSYPAKRHLWFQLEDTAYVANVVLHGAGGKLQPAK